MTFSILIPTMSIPQKIQADDFVSSQFSDDIHKYLDCLVSHFTTSNISQIELLAVELDKAWKYHRRVFICGNGGSAANAIHMANDFHYGIGACGTGKKIPGLMVEALSANVGVITCLANDTGYSNIYSNQLQVKAEKNDILIVLSGSGNSPNIINALETSRHIGMSSFALVAFDGGQAKLIADTVIHFPVNDMQIAEDTQLIVGHICMQWLAKNKPSGFSELL